MISNIRDQLIRDEGSVPYAYQDSLGYWTIGVGRLIDKRKGGKLSKEEIDFLLDNDIKEKTKEVKLAIPWMTQLSSTRQAVLINMSFQLGVPGLLGFKNTLQLIKDGKYTDAGNNMRKSKWHQQTPDRCERLIKQLITDSWQ